MRRIILALFLLCIFSVANAAEFRPNTIQNIDATLELEARGSFSGTITSGDELSVLALEPINDNTQHITIIEEYIEIGGERILPAKTTRNGMQYAMFEIPNLYKYAQTPNFKIYRKMNAKKTVNLGINGDYNIANLPKNDTYLLPTNYIESDDRTLVSKAQLEFTSGSFLGSVAQISEWVNTNITYDFENYYGSTFSARATYDSKAGVCDEFANLTAAFMRIKGIPAAYVGGISFDGNVFGNHGWVEVYSPATGWIAVDSTFGEAGYVDAAHIVFSRTKDSNDAADYIVSTKSTDPIDVQTELLLPKVQINSVEFFSENLASAVESTQVFPGEFFTVEAIIENLLDRDVIVPAELILHSDFDYDKGAKILHLKPKETRKISWEVSAPQKDVSTGSYIYGMYLFTPDGNTSGKITLSQGTPAPALGFRILEVSPKIDANNAAIILKARNLGTDEQNFEVKIYSGKDELYSAQESLAAGSILEKEYKFSGFESGTLKLEILADRKYEYLVNIPKDQKPAILEIVQEKPVPLQEDEKTPNQGIIYAIIAIAAAGILATAGIGFLVLKKL